MMVTKYSSLAYMRGDVEIDANRKRKLKIKELEAEKRDMEN